MSIQNYDSSIERGVYKMKRCSRRLYTGILAIILGIGMLKINVSANENESDTIHEQELIKQATTYSSEQALVLDENTDTYVVADSSYVNKARGNYYVYKKLNFGVMTVKTQITVNEKTGKITSTSIIKSNNKYYALYDISFNSSKTIAYFTVTVYNKPFIGSGLGSAVKTLYSTVKA